MQGVIIVGQNEMTVELTQTDEEILNLLQEGRCTPGYIVDESGISRQQVHSRLNVLLAADYIKKVHDSTGLYELVKDPREE